VIVQLIAVMVDIGTSRSVLRAGPSGGSNPGENFFAGLRSMSDHALNRAVRGRYLPLMQQGPGFMEWRPDGALKPSVARPGLVTAGAAVILLGLGCLILGVFAGFGPASESASAAPAGASPSTDPLASDPLTSGQADPTPQPTPVSRSVVRRPAAKPEPTKAPATTRPKPKTKAPTSPSSTGTELPECRPGDGFSGPPPDWDDRNDRRDRNDRPKCQWPSYPGWPTEWPTYPGWPGGSGWSNG
jgi:hypothetical protein